MFLHIIIIQSSFHIKHLDLSHNEFGEESGEILGPALGNTVYIYTHVHVYMSLHCIYEKILLCLL